jgi:hypothetical protein
MNNISLFGEMEQDSLKSEDVMFFQISEAVFQNWTFLKCPFFKIGGRLLKKTLKNTFRA